MLMAHNTLIRGTARTATIKHIFHMQQGVHYTENTDAIAVMWENKNKKYWRIKKYNYMQIHNILPAMSWMNISHLQIWLP